MTPQSEHALILAQALYDIRLLLAGHLGTQGAGDKCVTAAAHLAYALHNEAEAVLRGEGYDLDAVLRKIAVVDLMFGENFTPRFAALVPRVPGSTQ